MRTLLERQREQILADCQAEIQKHEFQADYDRRNIQKLNETIESQKEEICRAHQGDERRRQDQQLLHEQLLKQNWDLREAHEKSLNEMEELKRFQGSTLKAQDFEPVRQRVVCAMKCDGAPTQPADNHQSIAALHQRWRTANVTLLHWESGPPYSFQLWGTGPWCGSATLQGRQDAALPCAVSLYTAHRVGKLRGLPKSRSAKFKKDCSIAHDSYRRTPLQQKLREGTCAAPGPRRCPHPL